MDKLTAIVICLKMKQKLKNNFKKTFCIFSFAFLIAILFFIPTCFAGTYGNNVYGVGNYGIGYVAPVTPSSGGGSSGGGGSAVVNDFEVNEDLFHIKIKQGENQRKTLEIKSLSKTNVSIFINFTELSDFLIISEDEFTLFSGETKIINLDFFSKEKENSDAYSGRIIIKSKSTQKIINVIVEVQEKLPLFDLRVDISNKKVVSGGNLKFNLLTINQGDLTGFDILVHYSIKDFEGNVLEFKEESIKIDKQLEIQRNLIIPENISLGKYILYSRISYQNVNASGIDTFEVVTPNGLLLYNLFIAGIIISIIIIVLILFLIVKKED
jgi:hypothetical protein